MTFLLGVLFFGCTLVGFILGHVAAQRANRWKVITLWVMALATLYTYVMAIDTLSKLWIIAP